MKSERFLVGFCWRNDNGERGKAATFVAAENAALAKQVVVSLGQFAGETRTVTSVQPA